MKTKLIPVAMAAAALASWRLGAGPKEPAVRRFEATYTGNIPAAPAETKRLDVWVPLPSETDYQTVRDVKVETPVPSTRKKDSAGNALAYFSLHPKPGEETLVRVRFTVERREVNAASGAPAPKKALDDLGSYLGENRLVRLTPRVKSLAQELAGKVTDPMAKARAFYEYLVQNGTYDKVTPGWGKGDSERFCDLKKGNCTDFHSAFMALARTEKIPTRFIIGFPLKPEKEGTIPGYHCWAEFFVPGAGWVPVDASDASKTTDAARRTYLFGNLDPDRFEISRGRDLTLEPPQKDGPVNFFIYPYAEADGKAIEKPAIKLEYKDI